MKCTAAAADAAAAGASRETVRRPCASSPPGCMRFSLEEAEEAEEAAEERAVGGRGTSSSSV